VCTSPKAYFLPVFFSENLYLSFRVPEYISSCILVCFNINIILHFLFFVILLLVVLSSPPPKKNKSSNFAPNGNVQYNGAMTQKI